MAIMFGISVGTLGIMLKLYKQEILDTATRLLAESINGEILVGNYDITLFHHFPEISVSLSDIRIFGPDTAAGSRDFLHASTIDVNVEPLHLFQRKVTIKSIDIENGQVNIFRTSTGYSNLEVFKTHDKSESHQNVLLDLKKIKLTNVTLTFRDSLKHKSLVVQFIETENAATSADTAILFHIGGRIKVSELVLNPANGRFLKDKEISADINLLLIPRQQIISILPSGLQFNSSTVHLVGIVNTDGSGKAVLDIESDHLDYDEGLSILSDSLAKKMARYNIERPVNLKIKIAQYKPATIPEVDVWFSFQDSRVSARKIEMSGMSVEGFFTNHLDTSAVNDDHNSQLQFKNMHGVMNNLTIEGSATLTDLTDPALDLQATFKTNLKQLNVHLDTTKLKMEEGHFTSTFSYNGKLSEYLDETRTRYDGKLKGEASIINGMFHYREKNITANNINATFGFSEERFEIKRLGLRINKNNILIYGSITDFVPFFTTLEKRGKINLAISSPRLNMTGMLQPRKIKQTEAAKTRSRKKISRMVELVSKEVEFDIRFQIKEFIHNDFRASNANGTLVLANDKLILKKASLGFGRGTVNLDLNVSKLQSNLSPFTLDARLRNVGLKVFFHSFKNFDQKTMREDHVDGALSMDIHLKAAINDRFELVTSRLEGKANFNIIDGRLTNFEPMQNLSNFLFKGRDFSDIQFAEINSNIDLKGTSIEVERMEVQSTAISMFIAGQYDLYDSTNLSIQIPLSNLKKRDQDFAPENIGTDAKVGASVFLRVHPDKDGKTKISYDPFKKFRRKK